MSYNGNGVFVINTAGQPVVTGTTISSTTFNNLTADLATGLTTALTKDGQSTPTANIGMGAFKITNLAAGTVASDAARLDQVQGGSATFITAAGTDTITGTTSPALTAYATGNQFSFVVANTNTGAVTINVDGLGAKAITRTGTTALVAGDMVAGQTVEIIYDGTRFQLVNGNSFTNLKVSGTLGVTGVATFTAQPIVSSLTASLPVFTDASKGLVSNTMTGTGNVVMSTSPTLVTPALGTPSALVGTNITGTAAGLTSGNVTTNANLTGAITSVGNATSLGSFTSAQLATALTDETGSGAAVFATSPTLTTPVINGFTGNTSVINIGSGQVYKDASGNVGIGTSNNNVYDQVAQARPLVVQKSDTSTTLNGSLANITIVNGDTTTNNTAQLNFAAITGASTNQYSSASISTIFGARTNTVYPSGQLVFSTSTATQAPAERMRIDSSGNVGIGTSSPTAKLHVRTDALAAAIQWSDNINSTGFLSTVTGGSAINSNTALVFGSGTSSPERMRIDSSGNVGIGTASPGRRLDVSAATGLIGVTSSTGTNYAAFQALNTGGTMTLGLEGSASAIFSGSTAYSAIFGTGGAYSLHLATNNTVRATIDSSGNVGISNGNTSLTRSINSAVEVLSVVAGAATPTNQYGIFVNLTGDPNNTGNYFLSCNGSSSTERFTLRSNGGIANYSANNVNLSDRREKTNFAPAGDYLDKICAIPVQTFNYIDQNLEEDDGLTLGVVAQDVQAICPEMVMESNWAGKDEPEKLRLSIYQTDLQYALMKCIQEQQAIIIQLQADVATLKALSA